MSNDKARKDVTSTVNQALTGHPGYPEFESWCRSELIHPHNIYFLVWQASRTVWQPSRTDLVIQLPNQHDEKYQEYFDDVEGGCFNSSKYLGDVTMAIEAVGVKVKL